MITLPDLDDQRYRDIVEAAKRRIPVIFPEWTDFNEHDPGITIIELFAWLKEMQQYYLNRVSDKSRENMLRLLGIALRDPEPSRTVVCFGNEAPDRIIKGSTAVTSGGAVFTSPREFIRAPFKIGSVFIDNDGRFVDITDIAFETSTTFSPFGNSPDSGKRSLYINISEISGNSFYDGCEITFDTADRCPVPRNPLGGSTYSPRDIRWEYSAGSGFKECGIISDETRALSFSGKVTLKTGSDFAETELKGLPRGRWLRAELAYCGCEDMPLIRTIYTDTLELVQKKLYADHEDFILNGDSVSVSHFLAEQGFCFVFVRAADGWIFAEEAVIQKSESGINVGLSGYRETAAKDGKPNVRVVFCDKEFGTVNMFRSSDGLPCRSFLLDLDAPDGHILANELKIMVLDSADSDSPRWKEYGYIGSLSLAGPYDRCFTYDFLRRTIVFGDNENGEVPPKGDENIMIISCATTEGALGNVPAGNLTEISDASRSYSVIHSSDCRGGSDRENVWQAAQRMRESLRECTRAVTAEDYRTVAMQTPGLRIADAAAIPFFDPDMPEAPRERLANVVTIVVLPYSGVDFPAPDERFLAAVREHMENYRLITTRIKISAPVYVEIDIFACVICDTGEMKQAKKRLEAALRSMLSVYGEDGRTRFGEPVSESEVTARLCAVDSVLSVKQIKLSSDNVSCRRDGRGGIVIPPNAIAYCGAVTIETEAPKG